MRHHNEFTLQKMEEVNDKESIQALNGESTGLPLLSTYENISNEKPLEQ